MYQRIFASTLLGRNVSVLECWLSTTQHRMWNVLLFWKVFCFFRYTEEAGFFMAYIFFKCSLDGELWFHFLFPGQRSELWIDLPNSKIKDQIVFYPESLQAIFIFCHQKESEGLHQLEQRKKQWYSGKTYRNKIVLSSYCTIIIFFCPCSILCHANPSSNDASDQNMWKFLMLVSFLSYSTNKSL